MDDLIGQLRRDVEKRLKELEPLIEEKERLEAILATLASDLPAGRPRAASRQSSPSNRPKSADAPSRRSYARGKTRASRGANRDAILTLVGERPGISASEVANITQIAKATVHTTISQLKKKGILEPHGDRGVRLAQTSGSASRATDRGAARSVVDDEPGPYSGSDGQAAERGSGVAQPV